MKKIGIGIAAVLCVALLCGGFWMLKQKTDNREQQELTEVEKIIVRNMEDDYPTSPRAVIKLYNQIITCYYGASYTDAQLDDMADQALALFDEELAANNPKSDYVRQIKAEVKNYKDRKRTIVSSSVCDSKDVRWLNDPNNGDEIAYVTSSYFIKQDTKYDRTYQEYVLRKDESGKWKIRTFYQIEGKSNEDD